MVSFPNTTLRSETASGWAICFPPGTVVLAHTGHEVSTEFLCRGKVVAGDGKTHRVSFSLPADATADQALDDIKTRLEQQAGPLEVIDRDDDGFVMN